MSPDLASSFFMQQQSDSTVLSKKPGHPSQQLKSSQNSLIQELSRIYTKDINNLYEQIMKNVTSVIVSRKALFIYARSEGDSFEGNLNLFEKGTSNACFGCNMNYISHLLRFFARSNNGIAEVNSELVFKAKGGLLEALTETIVDMRLFNEMRNKARKAMVHLLGNNAKSVVFLEGIIERSEGGYVGLIIEIIRNMKEKIFVNQINESLKKKNNQGIVEIIDQEFMLSIYKKGVLKILSSLGKILEDSKKDSIIAQKCLLPILIFIQKELSYSDLKDIIKKLAKNKESEFKDLTKPNPDAMEEEVKEPKDLNKEIKEKGKTKEQSKVLNNKISRMT